ncbi:uncharacterized protein LOC126653574 [Mercurialis annua]|uniref:uncharacterized protein LOC126653574 n=1 Tax=Mercurialis annua TaxID=3986 RepID=UPI00215F8B10|nr:uncharacterized protein LOC126653574 [Mercurialis annua]
MISFISRMKFVIASHFRHWTHTSMNVKKRNEDQQQVGGNATSSWWRGQFFLTTHNRLALTFCHIIAPHFRSAIYVPPLQQDGVMWRQELAPLIMMSFLWFRILF